MGWPFSDITIYTPTKHLVGTREYYEEKDILNYITDLYKQKMNGYKPPKTSRITVQPHYFGVWQRPHKSGSITAVAPQFNYDDFLSKDRQGQLQCLLDLIQTAVMMCVEEFGWDKTIFENAYRGVLDSNFHFRKEYPLKHSRDRQKTARLILEKTERVTSISVEINVGNKLVIKNLLDKRNQGCFDSAYLIAQSNKWLTNDRFGFSLSKGLVQSWYSISHDKVIHMTRGELVDEINFSEFFMFERRTLNDF